MRGKPVTVYTVNKSDRCLVAIYRETRIGKRTVAVEHIADCLYCHGNSRRNARMIARALNRNS